MSKRGANLRINLELGLQLIDLIHDFNFSIFFRAASESPGMSPMTHSGERTRIDGL